jgi:hypothetical protein
MYDFNLFCVTGFSEWPSTRVLVDKKISRCRCTSYMAATSFGRILAAFGSRLLGSAPTVISRSAWRPPSPTNGSGSGLLAAAAVGISTRRASAATLWLASVQVPAASTYDFHTTHGKKLLRNRNTPISHS